MDRQPIDTSGISFTALYTGQVWAANGLSGPGFSTLRGELLYRSLAPFEHLSRTLVGGNLRTFLLQRHHLIDHLLHGAIARDGVTQVLEIACGLSPRGYRFTRAYPGLRYVETDLPAMAARKGKLLKRLGADPDRHRIQPCNILAPTGEDSLESVLASAFDPAAPLLVITEGLVNYFDLPTITSFWMRLRRSLAGFPLGIYLTDNYPLGPGQPFARTLRLLARSLGALSRSQVSFHFAGDGEAVRHFRGLGFDPVHCLNPLDFREQLPLPPVRGPSLVRVIDARVGPSSAAFPGT